MKIDINTALSKLDAVYTAVFTPFAVSLLYHLGVVMFGFMVEEIFRLHFMDHLTNEILINSVLVVAVIFLAGSMISLKMKIFVYYIFEIQGGH